MTTKVLINDSQSVVEENSPKLSAGKYVLLTILYIIPVIGWLVAFFHAVSNKNIAIKQYAQSFFQVVCIFLLVLAIAAIAFIVWSIIVGNWAVDFPSLINGLFNK